MSDRKKIIEAARHQTGLKPLPPFKHLETVSLDRPLTIIGSGRCSHVRARSKSVSRVHAVCLNLDGRVYLKDLASRGGVFLNDQAIRQACLKNGDRIRIGSGSFEFVDRDSVDVKEANPAAAHFSTNGGRSIHLVEQPVILIGHRSSADFVVSDDDVSSAHSIIFSVLDEWMLRDLDSRSGTFVNGRRVRQAVLRPGDVIGVGKARITFEPGDVPAAEVGGEPLSTNGSVQDAEAKAIEILDVPTEPESTAIPEARGDFEEIVEPNALAAVEPALMETSFRDAPGQPGAELVGAARSQPMAPVPAHVEVSATPPKTRQTPKDALQNPPHSFRVSPPIQDERPLPVPASVAEATRIDRGVPERTASEAPLNSLEAKRPELGGIVAGSSDRVSHEASPHFAISDQVASQVADWGPLAMAMLADLRPPTAGTAEEAPPAEVPATPTRFRRLAAMLGLLAFVLVASMLIVYRAGFPLPR